MTRGPLALVVHVAGILDDLDVPYALGGSIASSLLGEPRTTVDVDVAVGLDEMSGEALLARVDAEFYVPHDSARRAIRSHSSFNLLDRTSALKVDVFVAGDTLLDRMQLKRRMLIALPGAPDGIWVTSAEDQVLRKLDWYLLGEGASDRQWRDVLGILRLHRAELDVGYLESTASAVGLERLLLEAFAEAQSVE